MTEDEFKLNKSFLIKTILGVSAVIAYLFWSNSQHPFSSTGYNGGVYTVILMIATFGVLLIGSKLRELIEHKNEKKEIRYLEARLKTFQLTGDWREEKKINLELLWVAVYKKEFSKSTKKKEVITSSPLIPYLDELDKNNSLHLAFCKEVFMNLSNYFADEKHITDTIIDSEGINLSYKSASSLPFSVITFWNCASIVKSDRLKSYNNWITRGYDILAEGDSKYIDALEFLWRSIVFYLDVNSDELPTEFKENHEFGKAIMLESYGDLEI